MPFFPQQYRPTDDVRYIPVINNTAAASTTIVPLASSITAGHIKLYVLPRPAKIMQVQAVTGAGATTNTTLRVSSSIPGSVTALNADMTARGNTTGSLTASAFNNLDITADTVDTEVPPTLPAGTIIGVNLVTGASSTTDLHGFVLRLRYVGPNT